ncbi:MAG: IcmT/TraK family protein [gamma proteobacterium symbiont of Bathyaustriella thionipta]|nr:IcmT/TraK family protein [gamma proteobacterium symbiont of Bathyaustriella thionipta]MCU7954649.1 IcmT/TraK family protein [gamma proteobacterium symbiont of Bathyaustriella thionipta]MCU7957443.1 IcmT/TraK family protein [gamma proteobacterium symbiont of Bathyaustriella thionipta]MCU7966099.1 IcmT/TraK family protein [gamma proteobacterium symbiont of Bathyaustriella thionipta]
MALPDFTEVQWRNSGLQPRLGLGFAAIDAKVFVFFLIFLVYMSKITFIMSLSAIAFFAVLEYYGFGVNIAVKRFRSLIAGKDRVVHKAIHRRRRFIHG